MNKLTLDLSKFTEEELIALNQEIVERIKYIRKFNDLEKIVKFKLGDIVSFHPNGQKKRMGIIIRLNTKTVSIITADHIRWSVPVQAINKVKYSDALALKELKDLQKKIAL